jgi:hypothetical protein
MKFSIHCTLERIIPFGTSGYLLSREKGKGSIRIPNKARTNNCFIVAITIEKMERNFTVTHFSVHLENCELIYFTENNFQELLYFPPKTILTTTAVLPLRLFRLKPKAVNFNGQKEIATFFTV